MKPSSLPPGWSPRDMQRRQWVLTHPGACKDISLRCKVSAEYVRLVLYGKRGRKGKGAMDVIKELKRKGAPV